ncbi:MAG: hypothetical protein LBT96_03975 [Campylobacteraceae bacterium]|jgi:hypothetical protein|nr:hypothetical protein [Campylobacteraceae bacterium]
MKYEVLLSELKSAFELTNSKDITKWALKSVSRFPKIGIRRLKNFGILTVFVTLGIFRETKDAISAAKEKKFSSHLKNRTSEAYNSAIGFASRMNKTFKTFKNTFLDNPKENGFGVLALGLGFLMGSGGLDGDGGIPDTDIGLFGIGEHRSILTHSIIAGIIFEGSILALADFADIICEKIPKEERSEFWDKLSKVKSGIAEKLVQGTSVGIAYHLAVDATLQPAPYKDLPFSMPMEAHQLLFALNAAIEGNDVVSKAKTVGTNIKKVFHFKKLKSSEVQS